MVRVQHAHAERAARAARSTDGDACRAGIARVQPSAPPGAGELVSSTVAAPLRPPRAAALKPAMPPPTTSDVRGADDFLVAVGSRPPDVQPAEPGHAPDPTARTTANPAT